MTSRLRVATLNTWKGDGAYWRRLEAMARGLAELELDALCLQECFAAPERGADTAAFLSARLSMRAILAPARQKPRILEGRSIDSTSGLSVLARGDIGEVTLLDFNSGSLDGDRIALRVHALIRGERIRLVNVHLSHLQGSAGAALRGRQAAEAIRFAHMGASGLTVLCGDFNARLGAPELIPIVEADIVDRGPSRLGSTLVRQARGTGFDRRAAPDTQQDGAIDHVFLVGRQGRILDCRLALTEPDPRDRLHPSDHAAVVAEIDPHARRGALE